MWIVKADDTKARKYKTIFYKLASLGFDEKSGLKKYVRDAKKRSKAYRYFTKEKVDEFLTVRPERLMELHDEVIRELGDAHGVLPKVEESFIRHLFNYDSYIKGNKELSYALAHLLNVNTCTYCNRQYTLTVDGIKGKIATGEHLIRPVFDHWFSQKDYPELALSYYNLIPACHVCNSNLKRDTEMKLAEHIHPYMDKESGFRFSYVPTSEGYAVDIVRGKDVDGNYYKKVVNTLDLFKIPQIYGAHSGLELKDMISLATANHPDYISTLVNDVVSKLEVTKEDAYRMLFGIETNEEDYLKRPMSKFKTDILKRIKEDFAQ